MATKFTQEEFELKVREVHGNKYCLSLAMYSGVDTKVTVTCQEHGAFQIKPYHLIKRQQGCRKCGNMRIAYSKTVSREEWLKRFHDRHGDRYDYSQAEISGAKSKIKIICRIHGEFWQIAGEHCSAGCPVCGRLSAKENIKLTNDEFLTKARSIHGDKYDYSKAPYVSMIDHMTIICPSHGEFRQSAVLHTQGSGCQKCSHISTSYKIRKTTSQFIKEATAIHGDKFDYSRVQYKNTKSHVEILCKQHDEWFTQSPDKHLSGVMTCSKCQAPSKGERRVTEVLDRLGISYEPQKRFKSCRGPGNGIMPFDFYVPGFNLLIEYDGELHTGLGRWKDDNQERLLQTQRNDKLKTKWAKDNGYGLIRIDYREFDQIENILTESIEAYSCNSHCL